MARKQKIEVEESGSNVFADLGLANPKQELLKARLTLEIYQIVKRRKLTQRQAGEILGIKQPSVSLLVRNRSGTFSVAKLMAFLTKLDRDVEITARPKRRDKGEVSVVLR